ncbi:MAG: response regulator [Bacteroidota bacterium]|nr:response regulator [Bacteroidota bacterium]MDP4218634.1 response regulator [Bacteroidota bacterium]MDP4246767.1 response regulator [Bacteroidota bacterium]MDP4253791.1 response regulator [Bacteroidota bacterium]MDP4259601.1 response regulator [Bacteroidota bacterium]
MKQQGVDLLLVEDNISDAELTIRHLKKNNMANSLIHVKNGEEALEFIFATGKYGDQIDHIQRPKLILLDIHMPKVSGIEVLQKIKADPRTQSIPVIILTSSKEDPDIQKCYALGANSYIVKPVNFESFAEAIKNLGFYWLLLNQPPVNKV